MSNGRGYLLGFYEDHRGLRHKPILYIKLSETGQLGSAMNYKIRGKCDDGGTRKVHVPSKVTDTAHLQPAMPCTLYENFWFFKRNQKY